MLIWMFIIFLVLLLLGIPVAIVLGLAPIFILLGQNTVSGLLVPQRMITALDSFSLMAIPFFMLAGEIMNSSGISRRIIGFANTLVGHIKGGLAHTAVVSGVIFAGISGSSNADAAAIGSVLVPTMLEDKYDKGFVVSLIASAGALGPIIPPSILMIIYSNITGISIGKLFLAGVIPGIVIAGFFMVVSYFYAVKNHPPLRDKFNLGKVWNGFKDAVWALLMPVIIVGGVLSGATTVTEAGVIAVVYGLLYGLLTRQFQIKNLKKILVNAAVSTAVPSLAIATATIFSWMLAREQFPNIVVNLFYHISNNPQVILLVIVAFLLVLGMFVEAVAAMIMLIPVFQPLVLNFGFDPLHFAMVVILAIIIGGLTPPVGMLLYIVAGIAKAKMSELIRPVWKFVGVILLAIILIIFIPGIVTWLPRVLMG